MEFHLPMLLPHSSLNIQNLIHSVNPKSKPAREIQRTFSATKTTKHTAPSTDPTKRVPSKRKEGRVENAQAGLRRRMLRERLDRKLGAINPRFLPGKDPIPSEIYEPTNDIETCIASLNTKHIFMFTAHRNQQAFDRNSKRKAMKKRNAQMDVHDQMAAGLRREKWLDAEAAALEAQLTEVEENSSHVQQDSQPNEVQETSQESSVRISLSCDLDEVSTDSVVSWTPQVAANQTSITPPSSTKPWTRANGLNISTRA
ncbi:uncharacterized protein EV420DRAFT_20973 [Desarmillaria tabescens]|uniref:Uncharacterized protein n=1 Tax=Armillaria tabescens TaxID=1929756 RepID=A0AA39TT11_ARMTA|nr:uncharacterized protein EV420DRAFT_20973 [Desarmillaria tabescens]KAK0469287.1 hypothetical protein EV420DRAFT_20973 [Desarmillaria tabescens]